jgi:hypothetical protein
MPGTVIGTTMNRGYAGQISRMDGSTRVMAKAVKTAALPFGRTAKLNTDNTYSPITTGDAVTDFAGVAARTVKQPASFAAQNALAQYEVGQVADVITNGEVTIYLADGTATAGGGVFMCTTSGGAIAVGDFVAGASPTGGGTGTLLTNVRFTTDKVDANGMTEIYIALNIKA